jgi:hypothetical protein
VRLVLLVDSPDSSPIQLPLLRLGTVQVADVECQRNVDQKLQKFHEAAEILIIRK